LSSKFPPAGGILLKSILGDYKGLNRVSFSELDASDAFVDDLNEAADAAADGQLGDS
jgi:hypothetical protein